MKKIFKKLVAVVAMAAVCFTTATPLNAEARIIDANRVPLCFHDTLVQTRVIEDYKIVEDTTHEYIYTADKNNNGIPETVYGICDWGYYDTIYEGTCVCGQRREIVTERYEYHMDCGLGTKLVEE